MYRRMISVALAAALMGAACVPAAGNGVTAEEAAVTLIVEIEGAPLLEDEGVALMGARGFMETDRASEAEARLLDVQEDVKSRIERLVGADTDSGFTYTSVINGFSMEAKESDIEKIRSVDGVKNVYIAESFEVPVLTEAEGEASLGAQMINAPAMYAAGYNGSGQAVAILDGAVDVKHEFFAAPIENPRLSKDYIKSFIDDNELNMNATADQVYKSEKIPFAYDYGGKDADVFKEGSRHGTHVAGIAAGKNGVFEGTTFSGVAPEAQLVLMKISGEDDSIKEDAVLAAMDDASKMDVCAINISIGGGSAERPAESRAADNLRNAGIAVICGGGNSDRSEETAENPDYIYPFFPASSSRATSVASIDADKEWAEYGRITLGDGDTFLTAAYKENLFTKFSDKFYEYVYANSEGELQAVDLTGKIVVAPQGAVHSSSLLRRGVSGIIYISADEVEGSVSTVSSDIPAIKVRKSYGARFVNAKTRTLKTDAEAVFAKTDVPGAGMSSYTSWGTNADLELKPEITAPGKHILSSVPGNKYENYSGTSMASPQITGAVALMQSFVADKYPGVTGAARTSLIENLLMSSARIVFQDEEQTLPESPRRQGAGLADLAAAMRLPVILKGDGGKSKLSLKDMLTDDIKLTFTAENLTDTDVTYDDIKLYVFTDAYVEDDETEEDMVFGSTELLFTSDVPKSVTVPANGEKEITVNIALDGEQSAENQAVFTNGFWVDGFVELGAKDGHTPKASIPFTGFHGDWTAFDALTPSYFEPGGSAENGYIALRGDSKYLILGTNFYVDDLDIEHEYESENYVGFSPDKGGYRLLVRSRRSLKDVTLTVKDAAGNVVSERNVPNGVYRREKDECVGMALYNGLPDGDYTLTLSGRLAYDSDRSRVETKTYKFYMDSSPPQIREPKIYESNGRKYASFKAIDDRYLMGAEARDANGGYETAAVKAEKEAEIVIDITGMDEKSLEFTVEDYAYNGNKFKIGQVSAEITDKLKEGEYAALSTDVMNTTAVNDLNVIMAVYSGDGRLLGVETQNIKLESGEKATLSFAFDSVTEAAEAKLFVWEHGKLVPLAVPEATARFD